MIINLQPPDINKCREVALRRVAERTNAGSLDPKKHKRNFKKHFTGTLGEYALCKYFSCKWLGKYFEGKDWDNRTWDTEVGEARATFYPYEEKGMRMYPSDDRPDAPYIWVNLRRFGYKDIPMVVRAEFIGWAWQNDIHPPLKDWWKERYWILPQDHLRPMNSLPTIK